METRLSSVSYGLDARTPQPFQIATRDAANHDGLRLANEVGSRLPSKSASENPLFRVGLNATVPAAPVGAALAFILPAGLGACTACSVVQTRKWRWLNDDFTALA